MNLLGGMSDEERLAFEQTTGIKTEGALRIVEEAQAQAQGMLSTAIREIQEVVGPHGSVTRVQAGGVRVSRSGVGVYEDGILKTTIESDGDLFVGSDTALPATTTFSVFVNDQTYNNEDMGAGDLLIGDNTDGFSNVKYDASEGQLQFRLGTTVNVYLDTDGALKAGGGNVIIDANGIAMANSATSWFNFRDAAGNIGTINIAATPTNVLEIVNLATSPAGTIAFYVKDTAGNTKRVLQLLEDPNNANGLFAHMDLPAAGARFTIGSSNNVTIWAGKDGTETIFNNDSFDVDFRVEGATDANLFKVDAGLDAIGIGTATPTAKLNVEGAVIINDTGANVDTRIEGDTDANLFFVDASADSVGIGTAAPQYKLDISNGDINIAAGQVYRIGGVDTSNWKPFAATWTRTGNHTFTVSGDETTTFRKGAKVRYKDGGAFEYGVVASSVFGSVTTVTLITNTDYAMAAATITDTAISYIENPDDFPYEFSFTPAYTNLTVGSGTNTGKWNYQHGIMKFRTYWTFGTGSAVGTTPVLTLPLATATYGSGTAIGITRYKDATGGFANSGVIFNDGVIVVLNSGGAYATGDTLTALIPFTWATSDIMTIEGSYFA